MVEFFKEYNKETPSWEEVLKNFDDSINNKEFIKAYKFGFFVSHHADRIHKVFKVLEHLKLKSAHLYFNLFSKSETFGKHKDTMDVWFWQIKGSTKWIIEDKDEYILSESDLIYVPKGIYHEVVPLEPRAGISMSME